MRSPSTEPVEDVGDLRQSLRREQQRDRRTDRLGGRVPVDPFRRLVPGQDRACEVLAEDRILRRSDDRLELRDPGGARSLRERLEEDYSDVGPDRIGANRKPLLVQSIVPVRDKAKIASCLRDDHVPVGAGPPQLLPGMRVGIDEQLAHHRGRFDPDDATARGVHKHDPEALVAVRILEPQDESSAGKSLQQSEQLSELEIVDDVPLGAGSTTLRAAHGSSDRASRACARPPRQRWKRSAGSVRPTRSQSRFTVWSTMSSTDSGRW